MRLPASVSQGRATVFVFVRNLRSRFHGHEHENSVLPLRSLKRIPSKYKEFQGEPDYVVGPEFGNQLKQHMSDFQKIFGMQAGRIRSVPISEHRSQRQTCWVFAIRAQLQWCG
jgi:hypothetical protein